MAPVILSMDVHCHGCAKKIRKAIMKLPGVDSVTFGTGLVLIEGTADPAVLRSRLQDKTGKAVNVVSNGVEDGEAASGGGRVNGHASPPPRAPIILEMELHCRSCAKKVEKRVMQIPGVDTVTTDVVARRVEVTGTADASAVATSLQVRTRSSVRVVSDSRRLDFPAGYDHEQRKAVAAWAAAQQMYGEPREAATDPSGASSSAPLPVAPCCRRRRGRRPRAPAPSPPVQPGSSSNRLPSPPLQSYGAPAPQAAGAGYYYPALGMYGGQYWAAALSQPPVGFYTGQWPAYPPPEGYPWQGGEVYGGQQMWAPCQQDENPHICRVQ
ncbi:unnamed protein product [Miscanthus lutarioriparius]|uniref:HMA domain-containing protein n=1 Tax=Miscanthus lutarioriparius TaxID=422564 RepID=A0A811MIY9_9POAL|nr:unnamed protein product [Miscanthus lutarioriparius]